MMDICILLWNRRKGIFIRNFTWRSVWVFKSKRRRERRMLKSKLFLACECRVNTHQKFVFWSILEGSVTFISLWGTENIKRMSEEKFVLPRNHGKHVHISSTHTLQTCGLIFNKLGIQGFSVIFIKISKSGIRNSR